MNETITLISEKEVKKARKEYDCNASLFIRDYLNNCIDLPFSFAEKRAIILAKRNGWKILKGQPYTKQFNSVDGKTYTFRVIPSMNQICIKYKMY